MGGITGAALTACDSGSCSVDSAAPTVLGGLHCKRKTPVTSRYTRKMSECTGRLPEFQECTGGLPDFFYIT